MKLAKTLPGLLVTSLLLTACGTGTVTASGVAPVIKAQVQETTAQTLTVETKVASKLKGSVAMEPIKLEPVSKELVQANIIRKAPSLKTAKEADHEKPSAEEEAEIARLLAEAESKIAEEDKAMASSDFKVKSAGHGADVDIELFLYHPKYGAKAKSKGIKTAADFLEAAKSPWRRWTLKLKLEGLFAPSGFNAQILYWAEQADLLRITGISREMAPLLLAQGITSVPDLAYRTNIVEQGAIVLNLKLLALQAGIKGPSLDDFKAWVNEAKTLQPVLY